MMPYLTDVTLSPEEKKGGETPISFGSSTSAIQKLPSPEESYVKQLKHKLDQFIDNRLNEENWLGTLVIPLTMYKTYQPAQLARQRKVNGEPRPEIGRSISKQFFIAEKAWAFYSQRGALFPEGKNAAERAANAILNPQKSSLQLEYLLLLPSRLMSLYAPLKAGLNAHGIGLGKGEKPFLQEKFRLYQSAVQATWIASLGIGHFKAHRQLVNKESDEAIKEAPLSFQHSQSVAQTASKGQKLEGLDVGRILRENWKHNKMLLVGLATELIMPVFVGLEDWQRSNDKSSMTAVATIRNALTYMLVIAAYNIYVLQRITRDNFKEGKHTHESRQQEKKNLLQMEWGR